MMSMLVSNGKFLNVLSDYVAKNPEDVEVYSLLGTMLRESGYVMKAFKIHRNILAKPDLSKAFRIKVSVELAKDLYAHDNLEQTEKLIQTVLNSDSKNQDALLLLFNICRNRADFENAVEIAEKLQNLDPKLLSGAYTDWAAKLIGAGEHAKARRVLKKALAKSAENIDALTMMGDSEIKLERYRDAIQTYLEAINKNPAYTGQILPKLENAFYQDNSYEEYSTRLREELSDKTDNPDMHFELGKFLKKRRLVNDAKDEFRKALEFNPTHIEAREELLSILFDEKNSDRIKLEVRELFSELKKNMHYFCTKCSHREKNIRWRCPSCGAFDSFEKRVFLF